MNFQEVNVIVEELLKEMGYKVDFKKIGLEKGF